MRERNGRYGRLAVHAKAMAPRVVGLSLVVAAALVLVLARTHEPAVERVRGGFVAVLAPLLAALAQPVTFARNVAEGVDDLFDTYGDNARLRDEVARLQQWQAVARRLEQENATYRAMLQVKREPQPVFVTARVIADAGGPFVRTFLVNAGARDGVAKGQPVLAGEGLVGRVVEVAERVSRVLLLSDLNSRVPVTVERSHYRAVLAGDNSRRLRLVFLPASARVEVGERVVTSGHGGVFPPGVPVGIVASVADGEIRVEPIVDFDRVEYVNVVRYELGRLVGSGAAAGKGPS